MKRRRVVEAERAGAGWLLTLSCGHVSAKPFVYPARIGNAARDRSTPLPPPGTRRCDPCSSGVLDDQEALPGMEDL